MDSLLSSRRQRAEDRKWARIARELDRELGPVTHEPVPMRDGESVAEWRARNRASIEAHLSGREGWLSASQGWDWAQHQEYWS